MQTVKDYLAKVNQSRGGWYWLGTYGNLGTQSLWDQKARQEGIEDWYVRHADARVKGLGKKVFDCIGIDKYARWVQPDGSVPYIKSTDWNQETLFTNAKAKGMKWGVISTIPNVPGIMVYLKGHIGVYLGNGKILEARGGAYGVVETTVATRNFTHWFYNPFIDYEGGTVEMSNQVEAWQKTLNTRGANPVLDVDGDFADKSLNASNALVKKLDTEIASLKKQVTDLTSSKKLLSDNLVNTNEALSDCKELIDIKERANASYVERNAILNNSVERLEAEKTADKEYINQLYSENLSLKSEPEKPIEVIPPVVIKVADATVGELLGAIWSKIKGL
jgi:hypothetical protein